MTLKKFVSRYSNCNGGLEKTSFFSSQKVGFKCWQNLALIAGLKKWHIEIIIVLLVVELNISERSVWTPLISSFLIKKNCVMKFEALKQQI